MPANMDWPVGDGDAYRFLAQINCAELPLDLWDGAGPRRGWLLIFGGYKNGRMDYKILHSEELGIERNPPMIPQNFYGEGAFISQKVPVMIKVNSSTRRTFQNEDGVLAIIGGRPDKFHPGIEIADPLNALIFEAISNQELGWQWQSGILTITVPMKDLQNGKYEPIIFDMGG